MKQTFTQDQLIRFLYKETSASETFAIKQALNDSKELMEEFRLLQYAQQQLPKIQFRPKRSSVQNILRYSKSAAVEHEV
jgi:hypothetical protein